MPLVTMLCAFFVAPLQAQGQSVEAYVQMSADKTTLTFFYDTKRATREGTTWGIEEKKEDHGWQIPAWSSTYNNPNTTTTKAVVDASFKDFRPTSTEFWFKQFKALTAIEGLQNLNTSEVIDMGGMFFGCSRLINLDLSTFNTSNVTNMSDMFDGCKALTSIDLKNFNTSNVMRMSEMFAHCSALTILDLKNFNTSNVTTMSWMFGDCSALTTLDLSSFNTSNVEVMRNMFWGCKSLTSLDLSTFNTSNVEVMEAMFWSCSALKSLDLSSFNTSNVTNMRWMFARCTKLASIVCDKTWKCEQSQDMFEGCTALKGAVAYDDSPTDVRMANPETGYFTKKVQDKPEVTTPEAYVQMSADKTTLTFFYDTKRASREGTTWGIEEKKENHGFQYPAWVSTDENGDTTTTKAVFDPSFKDFRPTSTAHWFEEFNVLTAIEGLQNLNTSNVTSMNSMFYSCSALTSLDLKNFNTEKVEDMRAMFLGCGALTSLDLSNFNTLNLKDIDNMFGYCSALKSIDLRGFKTEKVEDMQHMFNNCSALTSLDLSNFNTENVTNMSGMFADCSALTSLNLKNFNTDKVEYMVIMFQNCSNLASIVCNKTWKCERSQDMFKGCTALKGAVAYDESKTDVTMANPETGYFTKKAQDKPEVTIPEAYVQMSADKTTLTFFYDTKRATREGTTWGIEEKKEYKERQYPAWVGTYENPDTTTTKAVVDASFANFRPNSTASWFYCFKGITAIEGLQNLNTSEVTNMGGMFLDCAALTTLDISSFNTSNVKDMGGMYSGCSALTSLNLSSFNTSNVTNMFAMFYGCSALTSLNLSNFNTLNVMNMSGMFYGCSALTSLNLSSFNTSNVTNMGAMFDNCSSLTSLNLSNFNTLNVMNMSGMFYGCSALTALDLKNFNTEKVKRMDIMFWGCKSLNSLDLSNFNTSEVTNMSNMFARCSSLTALDLKSFNTKKVTNMGAIFYGCSALTALDLSIFNTEKVTIMSGIFAGCSSLTSLDFKNFNTSNATKMNAMFAGCSALKSLDLSNFNTSNVTGMNDMFSGCSALTSLDLKNFNTEKVTDMSGMFLGCSALTSLDLKNFNTEKVVSMEEMFKGCSKLAAIVSDKTWKCEDSQNMFKGCTALKGAVAYDESKVDVTMANPETGYFTKKVQDKPEVTTPEAYVHMSADKTTLTFCYDTKRATREGTTWGIEEKKEDNGQQYPAWAGTYQNSNYTITKAVFDDSFANFRPTSTAQWLQSLRSLINIEGLQNLNTSEVTDMHGMFAACSALTTLDLSTFNTSNVTKMFNMFNGCTGLKALDLKNFNTEKVEFMSRMFKDCSALTSLDLSNFNTSNVIGMNGMFEGCSTLKELDLKSFNTSNVTNMSGMFAGSSALTSLDLKGFNTEKVKYMVDMFYGCSKLASIISNKAWNCEQSQDMFKGCTAIKGAVAYDESKTDVTMANPETGYFTKKAQDKPEVTTPEAYVQMSADKSTLTFFYDTKRATREGTTWGINEKQQVGERVEPAWTGTYENPDTTTTKAVIDASFKDFRPTSTASWFKRFKALTAIEGLQYLNTSEVTNMSDMFYYCSALTSLDLKNFNTSNVTEMNWMFTNCAALTSLDLTSFNTEKVTDMGWMFAGCKALTSLYLKNFNTQKVWNMSEMFSHCSALTSLDLSSFNTSNVENIVSMFAGCESLTTLDLSNFNTSNVTDMRTMFWACSGLTTLYLANFNTSNVKNMGYMFAHCSKLANIFSNKTWNCEESQAMFKGCTALKGAVAYDESKVDVTMANSETGYFTKKVEDKPEVTTPQAYVQMSADKTTLTFFYDTKRASREGTTWDITSPIATRSASPLNAPAWGASEEKPNSTTTKVVFDASFAKFYPKTTAEWFAHYAALKRIEGIENLNTSEVTSMKGMFTGCAALDTLDLTTFNTDKVNDMSEMFKNCANLSTVVCDKVWSTPHSEQMFYGCVKLLGKAAFDAQKTSVEMANPNSGYFVAVKPTALLPVFSPAGANGIYTLQGKRVRGNLQHLPAGVYIVNGKKVVVQ